MLQRYTGEFSHLITENVTMYSNDNPFCTIYNHYRFLDLFLVLLRKIFKYELVSSF